VLEKHGTRHKHAGSVWYELCGLLCTSQEEENLPGLPWAGGKPAKLLQEMHDTKLFCQPGYKFLLRVPVIPLQGNQAD
jgi:hypothetical protein